MNKKLTTDNRQPTTGKFLGILILLFVVCGGLFVSTPIIVLAQDTTEYTLLTPIEFVESSPGKATANSYIPGFIKLIIAIAGGLAVIQIIFGGIKYMSTDA
ncbi:MAG: hypothetical protein Q8O98_00950, partial [bacterium]|nr:hypothetical protein [bacterium]